jgi:hypothetical protein
VRSIFKAIFLVNLPRIHSKLRGMNADLQLRDVADTQAWLHNEQPLNMKSDEIIFADLSPLNLKQSLICSGPLRDYSVTTMQSSTTLLFLFFLASKTHYSQYSHSEFDIIPQIGAAPTISTAFRLPPSVYIRTRLFVWLFL